MVPRQHLSLCLRLRLCLSISGRVLTRREALKWMGLSKYTATLTYTCLAVNRTNALFTKDFVTLHRKYKTERERVAEEPAERACGLPLKNSRPLKEDK